ncbi:MAG: prepilin-type N-terminal cleavage/methylation domain-containing protein [Acholeplasmataceae bacterium]|nr:prepilin-type N-terminal cleavage/methylation domain-containing protein [Acholeplasmataceae bacterium]
MMIKKGVTLIELLAVLVLIGIIAPISVVLIGNLVENTRLKADIRTVENINYAISLYDVDYPENRISDHSYTNEEIFNLIVEHGYLSDYPTISSKNSILEWDETLKVFKLNVSGTYIPLSPLGDTYEEIAPEMIILMQEKFSTTGSYGRTWGDYQYTDVGLDPEDWDGYILHINYRPSGSLLRLTLEPGYQFVFDTIAGTTITIRSSFNWSIIYNDLDSNWYYHSVTPENQIDIDTLIVELT